MGKRRSFILYPFSVAFGAITSFRNFLFNSGLLHSEEFGLPVICVGNITVGGTGKTPHTEYLVDILKKDFRIAVLSRGYKRRSKGYMVISPSSAVRETGDEPFQLSRKFPGITVAVANDRVAGIRTILKEYPGTDVIILDDGFQHRKIKPGLSVLLSDFNNLMTEDFLLPYGNLRESLRNIKRADMLIITKSPSDVSGETMDKIRSDIRRISDKKLFFTSFVYADPVPVFRESAPDLLRLDDLRNKNCEAVLLTGIASPEPLKKHLEKYFAKIIHLKFADHHYFDEKDISKILAAREELRSEAKYLITTEKDSVRLTEFTNIAEEIKKSFYYVPVRVSFLNDTKKEFDNLIIDYVRKNKRDN